MNITELNYFLIIITLSLSGVFGGIISHLKGGESNSLGYFGTTISDNKIYTVFGELINKKGKSSNFEKVQYLDLNESFDFSSAKWTGSDIPKDVLPVSSLSCQGLGVNASELVCFGGDFLDDKSTPVQGPFFSFNASNETWTNLVLPDDAPQPRYGQATVKMSKDSIFMYGGKKFNTTQNGTEDVVWSLGKDRKWVPINTSNSESVSSRYHHTLTQITPTQFILIGGQLQKELPSLKQVFIFDTKTEKWEIKNTTNFPDKGVHSHTANLWNDKIIVFGGSDLTNKPIKRDVMALDVKTWAWSNLNVTKEVEPRFGHGSTLIGDSLLVFFGIMDPPSFSTISFNLTDNKLEEHHSSTETSNEVILGDAGYIRGQHSSSPMILIIITILGFSLVGYLWYRYSVKQVLDFQPLPSADQDDYDDLEFEEFNPEQRQFP